MEKINEFIKQLIFNFFDVFYSLLGQNKVIILIEKSNHTNDIESDLVRRAKFYFGEDNVAISIKSIHSKDIFKYIFNPSIKLTFGFDFKNQFFKYNQAKLLFYDIDYNQNPDDGWQWHHALTKYTYKRESLEKAIAKSSTNFKRYLSTIKKYDKAYIIGTGPSLSKAREVDWSDGYRIVCNTIVKDQEMWKHVNPHFIVAGDAIYHFGCNDFAFSFIEDLKNRMRESDTYFIYPFYFHPYVKRVLKEFDEKLIPIPTVKRDLIHISLLFDFRIPDDIGNVLNLLLLPLGCTLSKNVFLFGFDGRAPTDKLFWSNSAKHTYEDKLGEIIKQHPKFFEYNVPKQGETKYVNNVHGERLEKILSIAEKENWSFVMMHKSWTETLNRRFKN
jgi:hypothetical protein